MDKLSLDLEALDVDSFRIDEAEGEEGTVRGHEITTTACPPETTPWSCGIWCPPTQDPGPSEPCLC